MEEEENCKKLEAKYNELLEMLQESFEIYLEEEKEKSKRNHIFINYKKRVFDEIQKLKKEIQEQKKIIQIHKNNELHLNRELFILKSKFKHLSSIFKNKKENELLYKYFPDSVKVEKLIMSTIDKLFKEKFNPKNISVLYFRKHINAGLVDYLSKHIAEIIESEKLSVIVAQVILKEYKNFIYTIVTKKLLNKIEENEEFIDTLLNKKLVDKTKKYPSMKLDYTIDDIKAIIKYHNKTNSKTDINNLATKMEIEEIQKEKKALFEEKKVIESKLKKLKNNENDLLAIIVSEQNDGGAKRQLEEIDADARTLKDKLNFINKELTKLENRELFLHPLVEVKKVKDINELEKKYIKKYDDLILNFTNSLKELL